MLEQICLCGRGQTSSSQQQIQEDTDSFDIACSRKRNCSTVHRAGNPPFSETYLTSGSHIVEIARESLSVDAWRHGCDAIEVKQPTVPRHCALYLEHLEEDTWLVFIWGRHKRPFSGCSFCWKNEVKVHWLQNVRERAFMVVFFFFATVASKQTRKHIQDVFLRFLKDGNVIHAWFFEADFVSSNFSEKQKCFYYYNPNKQGPGYKQTAPTFRKDQKC